MLSCTFMVALVVLNSSSTTPDKSNEGKIYRKGLRNDHQRAFLGNVGSTSRKRQSLHRERQERWSLKANDAAPLLFPQLYRCKSKSITAGDYSNLSRSQSHEDTWLWDEFFGKLPDDDKYSGTFIEMGALDGLLFSNTYLFEKKYDWRGLLIEGHPANSRELRDNTGENSKRANVLAVTASICGAGPYDNLGKLNFTSSGGATGAAVELASLDFLNERHGGLNTASLNTFTVDCIPLQSILDAAGIKDVDFFSLDVEGAELAVLQTIDWMETNVRVILVEQDGTNPTKDKAVRQMMEEQGYLLNPFGESSKACTPDGGCTRNDVFVNPMYSELKQSRRSANNARRNYQYGTGMECMD